MPRFTRWQGIALCVAALVSTVWLAVTNQLILYIHPRYIVFTVIMTTRQMLSIVVSNYLFNHAMSLQSYTGAAIVFSVIAYSIYRKIRDKQAKDAVRAMV